MYNAIPELEHLVACLNTEARVAEFEDFDHLFFVDIFEEYSATLTSIVNSMVANQN